MLRTKIQRPALTPELINRRQLIAGLNSNLYKPLTLVCAPAGFGKSMLISQWIIQNDLKAAWITLDEGLDDLHSFLSIGVNAIQSVFPGSLGKLQLLLTSSVLPEMEVLYEEMVNGLDDLEGSLVIVLDDYHMIKDQDIHDFVNSYIQFPPENIHLVISTRRDPPLTISQLRLYNRIFEIRTAQLAFKQDEISEYIFVNKQINISKEISNQYLKKTEGWILGLKMLLFSSSDMEMNNISVSKIHQMKNFSDFIIQDFYKHLPEGFKDLLLIASLLDRFNVSLIDYLIECTHYTGEYSGDSFITEIIEKNLFVVSEDDEKEWFRFHHLFKELIQIQLLEKYENGKIDTYYLMISKWFLEQSDIDDAIHYAFKAEDYEYAALIIEKHRFRKYLDMQWWVIIKWMKRLPEEILFERPALISSELFTCLERFQYSEYPSLLVLLENKLTMYPDPIVEGELYYHKAFYYTFEICNADLALENLLKARSFTRNNEILLRRISFYTAVALQFKGDYHQAVDYINQEVEKNPESKISTLGYAAIAIHLLAGKVKEAAVSGKNYCLMIKGRNDPYMEAWGNFLYADALFQMCEMDKSALYFNQAIEIHPLFHYRLTVDSKIGHILSIFFSNENFQEEIFFEELEKSAENLGLLYLADSCKARVNLLLGNLDKALIWAQTYREEFQLSNAQFMIEVPLITKARVCIASNHIDKIKLCLDDLIEYHEKLLSINNQFHVIDILILQSLGSYKIGHHKEAAISLEEAIEIGNSTGIIRPFIEPGIQMKEMLSDLKINNSHNKFIHKIIERIDSTFSKGKLERTVMKRSYFKPKDFNLSKREMEIILEVSNGYRNQEIANKLFISLETVKSHVKNSMRKLEAKNRMELVRKVHAHGLIEN